MCLCVSSHLQLVQSLHVLSHHVLFHNLNTPEQILGLFPESFHSSLKNLIAKILLENRSGHTPLPPLVGQLPASSHVKP